MDIEKLIRRLRNDADAYRNGKTLGRAFADQEDVLDNAATALSTLQGENEKLRADVVRFNDLLASYQNVLVPELRVENENLKERIEDTRLEWYAKGFGEVIAEVKRLRAELEQVKRERDAAVSWAQKYTESIDRPCVACKHNTGDYVCTAICGNCGPMGTENCKWEFDFSGELKED